MKHQLPDIVSAFYVVQDRTGPHAQTRRQIYVRNSIVTEWLVILTKDASHDRWYGTRITGMEVRRPVRALSQKQIELIFAGLFPKVIP